MFVSVFFGILCMSECHEILYFAIFICNNLAK